MCKYTNPARQHGNFGMQTVSSHSANNTKDFDQDFAVFNFNFPGLNFSDAQEGAEQEMTKR